jgi:hypothetical protein
MKFHENEEKIDKLLNTLIKYNISSYSGVFSCLNDLYNMETIYSDIIYSFMIKIIETNGNLNMSASNQRIIQEFLIQNNETEVLIKFNQPNRGNTRRCLDFDDVVFDPDFDTNIHDRYFNQ